MLLSPEQIKEQLTTKLAGNWQHNDKTIKRSLTFDDFGHAFSFMTAVAFAAERRNHHPDWHNCYNRVEITLSTHDAGGITAKDIELAEFIDSVYRGWVS